MSSEAEKKKEWVRKQVEKFRREMQAQGVNVKGSVDGKDLDGYVEAEKLRIEMERGGEVERWARREQLKSDIQAIRKENEEDRREADPIGRGGSGQIRLSGATAPKNMEFNSREEMIDTLRRMESSNNPEAKKYAKAVLDELFRKTTEAIKNKELTGPIVFSEKPDSLSIIGRYKKRQKEKMKEKAGVD